MSPREHRQLPARPDLDQYRKQAKDLLKSWKAADPRTTQKLADAQFAIAREHGFATWKQFSDEIDRRTGKAEKTEIWTAAEAAVVAGDADTLERLLTAHEKMLRSEEPETSWFGGLTPNYSKGDARAVIAREHYFESWDAYAAFRKQFDAPASRVAEFERAVDAVAYGDADRLQALLQENPQLIQARSMRSHHSMLLHYVGANGVESWRQRPSKNAVRVAEVLLDAGAEIDAPADMYGGGSTALGLLATSIHPKTAGVLLPLIDLFVARGARLDAQGAGNAHSLVKGCLNNGRPEAAEHLASLGAPLDLEEAAGLGRLELVKSFFGDDGTLKEAGKARQMTAGFLNACGYGKTDVVEYLLDHGMDVNGTSREGETGLHYAALGGNVDTVRVVLKRKPKVDVRDGRFNATPLGWAMYSWWDCDSPAQREPFYEVASLLVAAGVPVEADWLKSQKVADDHRLFAILSRNP